MRTLALLSVLLCTALVPVTASAENCENLSSLKLTNTTITAAANVSAGGFTLPEGYSQQGVGGVPSFKTVPAFCRVQGVLQPSNDSHIEFEVWLPVSIWNGKYQGVGNGGFAGTIGYGEMANAIAQNYATASTDTGHSASGMIDAKWALGHPEKIVDFGYRAIHETAVTAKAIIQAFYGKSPLRSYFNSCSNGGRQALMEAQRFPEDYNGIIAGAPANAWTDLMASAIYDVRALSADKSYLSTAKLPAIQEAVIARCDMIDNVKDGVLENPPQCRLDLTKLLCTGQETDRCLTGAQLEALKKIYEGPRSAKGDPGFPGYSPGGEASGMGWGLWITGREPNQSLMFAFGTQFFQNMVYDNPSWNFGTSDWDRDKKAAEAKTGHMLNATAPDLSQFKKRGGKLILYHGWNDAAIPARNSINYYNSVVARMGQKEAGDFVRLFMVPGMQHCNGGAGPDSFGQAMTAQRDPEQDVGAALERWVEKGTAPDKIIATKYNSGSNPASGIVRTRPLCPYPQVAGYKGSGDTNEAASFACVQGK